MAARARQATSNSLLDSAVLGLVLEHPSYGYEIATRLERRFDGIVDASRAAVYKVLQRLNADGLIERTHATTAVSEGRPRIHYRATAQGVEEYSAWMAQAMLDDGGRAAVLSRLASVGLRRPEAILEVIERFEAECLEAATRASQSADAPNDATAGLLEDLMLEERRQTLQSRLAWAAYARNRLRTFNERAVRAEA